MKVRCVQLLNSLGNPVDSSGWAKLDAIYHVLSIWVEPGQTRLRLIGENPTPALFEPEMFEVVSSTIPGNWAITSPRPGCLDIGPLAWAQPFFWEQYFDHQPEAMACFKDELAKMVLSDP